MEYLLVALGGALGSIARLVCSGLAARRFGEVFPAGTLLVNVAGSFAIGLLEATLAGSAGAAPSRNQELRQLLMIGVFGGFTTFSALSLQTLTLVRDRERGLAMWNVLGTAALGLAAVGLGYAAGTFLAASFR